METIRRWAEEIGSKIPVFQNKLYLKTLFFVLFFVGFSLLAIFCYKSFFSSELNKEYSSEDLMDDVYELTNWKNSDEGISHKKIDWANESYGFRFIVRYSEMLWLRSSEGLNNSKSNSLYNNLSSILIENDFERDSKRQILSPYSGGVFYEVSEVWENGSDMYFIIKAYYTDSPEEYYIHFGYLGTTETIEEIEKEHSKIFESFPTESIKRTHYIDVDDDNNILLFNIFENESEIRVLTTFNHQSTERNIFYFSKSKLNGDIEPLIWEVWDGDSITNIRTCNDLDDKDISLSEITKLKEYLEDEAIDKSYLLEIIEDCFQE
jgi:hypothetical protein